MNTEYLAVRDIVVSMLSHFPEGSLTIGAIREQVKHASGFVSATQGIELDEESRERLIREIETTFNVWIGSPKILEDDTGHRRWLDAKRDAVEWRFWNRYSAYLRKEWATPATLQSVEKLTDDILGRLEDPERDGEWDRRGLVVGHVQSGKTANYTGLICKAADSGYRLIVVLAGMHNNLRSQTQVRLEEGFLGYSSLAGEAKAPIGAGLLDPSLKAGTITDRTDNGDFSKQVAQQFNIAPGQQPLLFVVKKNTHTLRNLLKWVQGFAHDHEAETGRQYVKGVPILVIDDEADQASVNSKKLDSEPTRINSLIRQLLYTFEQSAYVGYTATPFANIFIHDQARTEECGQDLFPRSFIISLPAPSNYMGPARVFGLAGDPEAGIDRVQAMPLIRSADDGRDWIPDRHKKHLVPNYPGDSVVPPSLHEAMLAFILAGAARDVRGMGSAHHSMLVHVTRFTDVQAHVARQVGEHLESLRLAMVYGEGASSKRLIDEMRDLWESDFVRTSAKTIPLLGDGDADLKPVAWDEIRPLIRKTLESIQIHVVNGTSADSLEYEAHRDVGLKVIAVGGDKLSRGLTLEGLTTSYFLRSSRMYDTLMQMGRWFGYRQGYIDLCRLYLPDDLREWFDHITEASEELRQEFDYMTVTGGTPKDYGLRVKSHPALLITSQVKMRSGVPLRLSFAGDTSETVVFERAEALIRENCDRTLEFIESMGDPDEPPGSPQLNSKKVIWSGRKPEEVVRFLNAYRTHPLAWRVNTKLLAEFIEKQVQRGNLVDWTVCLVSNDDAAAPHRDFGGIGIGLTLRGTASSGPYEDRLTIRRLVSPTDEALDLEHADYDLALEMTKSAMSDDNSEPKRPSGQAIRRVRGPRRGLLLIYPLSPDRVGRDDGLLDKTTPVVGFAISFPEIENAEKVDYRVTHLYWEQYYGANDWNDDADDEVHE